MWSKMFVLCAVVYDISDPPHPKLPCLAKVSTNHFLDIMTVKCQSGEFPNFLMLSWLPSVQIFALLCRSPYSTEWQENSHKVQ